MSGFRIAELADIPIVFENLSEISDAEIAAFGLSYEAAEAAAEEGVRRGCAFVAVHDDRPTCLFWFYPATGICYTYFLSAESYFDALVASTRATRRCLRACAAGFPASKMVSRTMSRHPGADKWFRLIGFRKIDEANGVKTFEYRST